MLAVGTFVKSSWTVLTNIKVSGSDALVKSVEVQQNTYCDFVYAFIER